MTPHTLRLVASAALALAVAAIAPTATGDDTQTLSLRDGTTVTGVVVEYIEGEQVTLRLANGDKRRVAWSDLATPPSAPRIVTLPLAPPLDAKPHDTTATVPSASPYHPGDAAVLLPDELRDEEVSSSAASASDSSLAFGVQGALNSPLGPLALAVDYFPFSWLGFEGMVGMPIGGAPVTLGEDLIIEWKLGNFGMGLGIGFAQAFTKAADSGDHPGVTNYLTADCSHFSLAVTDHLVLRATLGLAYALNNNDYCSAHPDSCPKVSDVPITGLLSAMWSFKLGGGG